MVQPHQYCHRVQEHPWDSQVEILEGFHRVQGVVGVGLQVTEFDLDIPFGFLESRAFGLLTSTILLFVFYPKEHGELVDEQVAKPGRI